MMPIEEKFLNRLYDICTDPDNVGGWINSLFSVVTPPMPYLSRELSFPELDL